VTVEPAATAAGTAQETANNEKLKDVNLTAKTDIVYEEPGDEKKHLPPGGR